MLTILFDSNNNKSYSRRGKITAESFQRFDRMKYLTVERSRQGVFRVQIRYVLP